MDLGFGVVQRNDSLRRASYDGTIREKEHPPRLHLAGRFEDRQRPRYRRRRDDESWRGELLIAARSQDRSGVGIRAAEERQGFDQSRGEYESNYQYPRTNKKPAPLEARQDRYATTTVAMSAARCRLIGYPS